MDDLQHQYKIEEGRILSGRFKLMQKIGVGSFGQVFKTQNLKTGEIVAAKFELRDERHSKSISLLIREIRVLTEIKGIVGFPRILFYGRDEHYNFFMETFLGSNLEDLHNKCGVKFTLPTVMNIAKQVIERIQSYLFENIFLSEELHQKNFIHRDIKPENFVIGRDNPSLIYIIDFGLSKYFRDSSSEHIPFVSNKGLIGTARYASINSLKGNEQSRRDDLEAIGYMILYFYVGKLPWMNLQVAKKEDKYKKILQLKEEMKLEMICHNPPKCFEEYFNYVYKLQFEEEPDYKHLIQIFETNEESQFDWLALDDFKKQTDISIEDQLGEIEVPSMLEEGNIQQSISKIPNYDRKFLGDKSFSSTSLIQKKQNNKNEASFDSKMNNYQQSKVPSNGLQIFTSSKQFELTTKLDLSILTPLKLNKQQFSDENEFEDQEVDQDDEANLVVRTSMINTRK